MTSQVINEELKSTTFTLEELHDKALSSMFSILVSIVAFQKFVQLGEFIYYTYIR